MEIGKKQVAAMLILLIGINAIGFWLWQSHQTIKIPPTVLEKYVEVHKDSDRAGIYLTFNERYQQRVYVVYGSKGRLMGTTYFSSTYYFSEDGNLLGEYSGPLEN